MNLLAQTGFEVRRRVGTISSTSIGSESIAPRIFDVSSISGVDSDRTLGGSLRNRTGVRETN